MIYHLASSQEVIAKLHRDLRIGSDSFHDDAIEWIADAMGLIGGKVAFPARESVVKVQNYTALLPLQLTQLLAVAWLPGVEQGDDESDEDFEARALDSPIELMEPAGGLQEARRLDGSPLGAYTVREGVLQVSRETGAALVLYKSPALDEKGYPLVPDHPSYRQALTWYIVLKLVEGGWSHPAGLRYDAVEARWLKYCTQARAASAYPDLQMLERIRDTWSTLVPDLTLFDNLFERYGHRPVGH